MTKGITITRTGDSNWYIKNTDFNDNPENVARLIKALNCDEVDCEVQQPG